MRQDAISRLGEVTNLSIYLSSKGEESCRIRAKEFPGPYGFSIVSEKQFSWIESRIEFDTFSSEIIRKMQETISSELIELQKSIDTYAVAKVDYLNFKNCLLNEELNTISNFRSRVYLDEIKSYDEAQFLSASSIIVPLSLLFSRILDSNQQNRIEDADQDAFPSEFDVEGREVYALSKMHERSRANRALAIQLHGISCHVCSFNFESTYGTLSKGYVEIHHLLPVSLMATPAVVDPRTDLVPLCANCHRMAHRRWPPYTPSELKSFIDDK